MLCTPSSIRVWHTARQLTNSIASGAPRRRFSTESATRIRRALVIGPCRPMPEAREQARPEQSDSIDSDAPGCGPCWPGPVPGGRPDPVRVTRTLGRERRRHRIRRSHPTPKPIWPTGPPFKTHPNRRCEGVPQRPGQRSCLAAARVCAVRKAGAAAVPRGATATQRGSRASTRSRKSYERLSRIANIFRVGAKFTIIVSLRQRSIRLQFASALLHLLSSL